MKILTNKYNYFIVFFVTFVQFNPDNILNHVSSLKLIL